MDFESKKFFKLNYLCSNIPDSIQNQKNLTIEKTISNDNNKIRKIKSNIISVSQNFIPQNYKKIKNNLLNKKILQNKNQKLFRTKSVYEKTFNDLYNSSILINSNSNKKIFKQKKFYEDNNDIDNYSQLNFTINNYIPILDNQFKENKDINKTYFIKIENPNNRNKKNKVINIKQTPLKTVFCINNNFSKVKLTNNKKQEIKKDNKHNIKFDLNKFLNDKNNIRFLLKNKGNLRNNKINNKQELLNKINQTEYLSTNLSNNSYLNKNIETQENQNINKEKKEKEKEKLNNNI